MAGVRGSRTLPPRTWSGRNGFEVRYCSVAGVLNIDFENGNSAFLTLTENITTVNLLNPPASGRLGQVEIEILQDSVARTIAWPAAVEWPGGTPPDLTTTSATYLVHLQTRVGGTTYLGLFEENFS